MSKKFARFYKNRLSLVGLIVLASLIIIALLGPLLIKHSPTEQNFATLQKPTLKHLMGTDDLGRDVLSRVVYGSRLSLAIGILAVTIAFLIGILFGSVSGYLGGFIDALIMRVVDIFLAFPYVLGAMALMVALGSGFLNVIVAIACFMWASFARLQRASVLELRQAEFVQAAKISKASMMYIIRRHIIPNSVSPLIVYAATGIGTAILGEAMLSFIQIGLQPPTPSLGLMLNDALPYIENAPWLMLFPGLFLFLIVLSFILIGDGLRDALDPNVT